jgi:hypothetical protein
MCDNAFRLALKHVVAWTCVTTLQNIVVTECPCSPVFCLYVTMSFLHVNIYTFHCHAVNNWILWEVLPNLTWNVLFVLISEISLYVCYCGSFASLQENENKMLIWKNVWGFVNFYVYIFKIWLALSTELHLYIHINYRWLVTCLQFVVYRSEHVVIGQEHISMLFNSIRISLDIDTRTVLLCWKSGVISALSKFLLKCSGD